MENNNNNTSRPLSSETWETLARAVFVAYCENKKPYLVYFVDDDVVNFCDRPSWDMPTKSVLPIYDEDESVNIYFNGGEANAYDVDVERWIFNNIADAMIETFDGAKRLDVDPYVLQFAERYERATAERRRLEDATRAEIIAAILKNVEDLERKVYSMANQYANELDETVDLKNFPPYVWRAVDRIRADRDAIASDDDKSGRTETVSAPFPLPKRSPLYDALSSLINSVDGVFYALVEAREEVEARLKAFDSACETVKTLCEED